jgi:hypothetical protein
MTKNHSVSAGGEAWASVLERELGLVADQFPEDVAAAAQTAALLRAALSVPDNVAAEPWPPMQMRLAP